jgi:hypothetical protein
MTMDLIGPHGERHFTHQAWMMLLDLAVQHGWHPAGTLEREREEEPDDEEAAVELDASEYEVPRDNPVAEALASLFPSGDPVLGTYFFNDGRRVTPADARALAEALKRALPDVPDHDAMKDKTFEHPSMPGVRLVDARTPVNPFEWFSGKKKVLRSFIAFCRRGGFEIW